VGRPRKHLNTAAPVVSGDQECMSTRHRTNSSSSLTQLERGDEDDLHESVGKMKRRSVTLWLRCLSPSPSPHLRKSGGLDEFEFGASRGGGKMADSYSFEDSSFEDLGEGDPGQGDYRSAFYDEESGEIYEGRSAPFCLASHRSSVSLLRQLGRRDEERERDLSLR
jgi:hypothetical protein